MRNCTKGFQRIGLAVAITLLALVAGATVPVADAQAPESTLHKVLKRGTVIVGTRSTTPGFAFKDDKGELVGFDIDLGRELAQGLFNDPSKVQFEVLPGGGDRIPALVSGRVDAVISQFSVFIERAQVAEFTLPYCNADFSAIVKASSPYKKNADLNGKAVAVRQGAELEKLILKAIPKAKVQGYQETTDAFLALRQGRAEAAFNDHAGGVFIMHRYPGQFRVILDPENALDRNQYSIGLRQGDQVWLNYLNWALIRMKLTGRLRELHMKWLKTIDLEPAWVRERY
ncbi:MAG: transporter substrate-binding domain-containing protein [Candidatus Rokubacteria bacterium]|nr:transporter substrate-binding domain-containing protein [Candidatus Rokubacteria bacterium]